MTTKSSEAQPKAARGRLIPITPAKVKAARLIVERAERGHGTASPAVRAMANARPARA